MNKADVAILDGHECVLLSALMNGTESLPVCANDFSSPPNRIIFECINSLTNRCLPAVTDALRRNRQLERVGGAGRLTEIAMMTHDKEVLQYSLDEVLEFSRVRKAEKIGQQLQAGEIGLVEAKAAVTHLIGQQQPRVAIVEPPQNPVTLAEWRDVIAKNFPSLTSAAEICLSVETQLLLNDVVNPFALALVDVPASGKTITLNFFKNPEELAYTTDYFSAAAFVSHATNVRREELANVDLLPRIRFKTAIVRELNSILGAKEDDLIKSLGILTRVLDGEGLQTDSGVHGRRGYSGDYTFMLLAGTTPIQPRVFRVMGNFGSRLFFLSLRSPDADNKELIALNRGKDRKCKEAECRKITEDFLRTLWSAHPQGVDWDKGGDPDDCLEVIANCARLLASLRGAINVYRLDTTDGEEKLSHSVPVIEKPHRINCLFANLARSHALICGRRQLADEDLWPVLEITFDSAPPSRAKIFRHLIEKDGTLKTSDVVDLLRCSSPTARKEMEALSVLGVVDKFDVAKTTMITLAERFAWFTSNECKAIRGSETGVGGDAGIHGSNSLLPVPTPVLLDESTHETPTN